MSAESKQFLERLYSKLPKNFRNADLETDKQLKRFLTIVAEGGLYKSYEETQKLLTLIDFNKIPTEYLPQLAGILGFKFPYDLDEQTQRTYIKNAALSYKIKGTERALRFMIRELTRFKTTIDIDEDNRSLDVRLEVDLNRQDFEQVVAKVDFLVREYAPPLKHYNLSNTFVWEEAWNHVFERETDGITSITFDPEKSEDYQRALIAEQEVATTLSMMVEEILTNKNYDDTELPFTVGYIPDLEVATKQYTEEAETVTLKAGIDSNGEIQKDWFLLCDENSLTNSEESVTAYDVDRYYGLQAQEEDFVTITMV